MFTGLIEQVGEIIHIEKMADSLRLTVRVVFDDLTLGESITVNGACLTLLSFESGLLQFEVSSETLACTNLGSLRHGQRVNMERAMKLNGRFGGHYVSGHVDTTVHMLSQTQVSDFMQWRIGSFLPEHRPFLLPKGSITLDGVSLTINQVGEDWIDLMLIPHTLTHTCFNLLDLSHRFNVEFDYLTRIVAHQLRIQAQMCEV